MVKIMLTGTYELRLNRSCALRLPKRIARELRAGSARKEVCFVAAEHLRCYTQSGARAYMDALRERRDAQSLAWARLVAANGTAKVSLGGMLRIPDKFCRVYGYQPKAKITLLGCGDYVELHPATDSPGPRCG